MKAYSSYPIVVMKNGAWYVLNGYLWSRKFKTQKGAEKCRERMEAFHLSMIDEGKAGDQGD